MVLRSALDRVLALIALIVFSPVMLLIALIVKLDSPGPIFYSQLRVGEGRRTTSGQYRGKVFALMKFRTMRADADRRLREVLADNEYGSAPFVKIKDDPRITRVGHFLRASSLDELPQLFNVVKGDMGLVGNRPLPLYEAEQLDDDWQRIRFNAPAGITGLWQISGRSDLSAEERIVLDNYYALTRSLWSDVRILLVTIPVLLARRGAR
jgi:lipopolysaccharide/colanic/teichoic acid biosynthesis glycosyltransferase